MDSPPPPDPYLALGVSKTAEASEIKSAYRKLVLRCHPDKIADPAQKAKAVEEFHKVQQAYELISDEEKRGRYDALIRLAELRRQKLEARGAESGSRTASSYDVRTAAPHGAAFAARGPSRTYTTDERRPNFYPSDEEPSRASARKSPQYQYVRRSAAPKTAERERDEERKRAGRRRDVDREADRSSKYEQHEEFARYEESRRRRDKEAHEEPSRRSPPRRAATDDHTTRSAEEAARAYMASSSSRPTSYERSSSSRDLPYHYVRRPPMESRDSRRSTREIPRESRRGPEIVESARPSTLRHHDSDPVGVAAAAAHRHREKPENHRSYTTQTDSDHRRSTEDFLPSRLSRSQTMPVQPDTSSSSRKPPQPSKLRTSDTNGPDSGYSSPATPDRAYPPPPPGPPPSSKSTYYSYAAPVNATNTKDYSTTYREPTSSAGAAPPPLRRSSPERNSSTSTRTARMMASLGQSAASRPPLSSRQASYSTPSGYEYRGSRSPERSGRAYAREASSRSGKLYGEVDSSSGFFGREGRARGSFVQADDSSMNYSSRRFGEDDGGVYAGGRSGRDKRSSVYAERPGRLSRQGTAVF